MNDRIRIERSELFSKEVDTALERNRNLAGRALPETPPLSPAQRLFMSSMFYLPLAGFLGALLAWMLIEPGFEDFAQVGGEVVLVNTDPFEANMLDMPDHYGRAVSLTVGSAEVLAFPGGTRMEAGPEGEEPFSSLADIGAGTYVEASGEFDESGHLIAMGLRPASEWHAERMGHERRDTTVVSLALFPLTALLIAVGLTTAEGIAGRNWVRMVERILLGGLLTLVFAFLGQIPAGVAMLVAELAFAGHDGFVTVHTLTAMELLLFIAGRSLAWASIGAATGVGLKLVRSTRVELRNAVIGGALGGALGGVFFDPVDRFVGGGSVFDGAATSRVVGLAAVGLCIGVFIALVDRLASEAWVRVRTGPLAGKSFVLYRSPTVIGSSPKAEIYVFKDAEVDATHAAIHRIANRFEIEDLSSRVGTVVGGQRIRRRRLTSGDQIQVGSTVLEFEERERRGGAGGRRP